MLFNVIEQKSQVRVCTSEYYLTRAYLEATVKFAAGPRAQGPPVPPVAPTLLHLQGSLSDSMVDEVVPILGTFMYKFDELPDRRCRRRADANRL